MFNNTIDNAERAIDELRLIRERRAKIAALRSGAELDVRYYFVRPDNALEAGAEFSLGGGTMALQVRSYIIGRLQGQIIFSIAGLAAIGIEVAPAPEDAG